MKKLLYILLALLPLFQLSAQDFEVKVHAKNIDGTHSVYLEYLNPIKGREILDSSLFDSNQEVIFKQKVKDQGGFYYIKFTKEEKPQRILMIIEGGENMLVEIDAINQEGKFGNYSIKSDNSFNLPYQNRLMEISRFMSETVQRLNQQFSEDQSKGPEIEAEFQTIQAKTVKEIEEMVPKMGSHLVALFATNFLSAEENKEIMVQIADNLSKDRANHPLVKSFVMSIKAMESVGIGAVAPEFTQETPEGEQLSLSSLKGKLVLLDFWASWCGPCRKENPNVVKTYAAYKDKGFEILGISLDERRESWLKAIEKDGLTWKHVSDLKYWKNEVALMYGVKFIPQTFLIDPNGKIIAQNLRGEALSEFLKDYYTKN